MVVETIGIVLLFLCYGFHNPSLSYSGSSEHIFGYYRKVERDFNVECFPQLEDMNRRKTYAIY